MPEDTKPVDRFPSNDKFLEKFEPIVEAWDSVGLMSNAKWGATAEVKNPFIRAAMAQQFENARKMYVPYSDQTFPQAGSVGPAAAAKANVQEAMKLAEQAARYQPNMQVFEATSPVDTTSMSGATNLPMVLGYIRKIMPKMRILEFVSIQPLAQPTGRVFFIDRLRHNNGTNNGSIEARAGWSFRSWDKSPGENTTIVQTAKFTLASENVSVADHKMLTEIGIEIEQDLRAYHGIDGAALINEAASDEMALELQEMILYELWARAGAGTFQIGTKPSGYTVSEWDRRFLEVVQRAAESIWTNQRVDARHLVLGSDWSVQLSNVNNTYAPTPTLPDFPQGDGQPSRDLRQIGDYLTLRVPLPFHTGTGLLLHKGTTWVDASFFYMPYQVFSPYSVFRNPATQTMQMSWLSRYATLMVGTNFRGDRRVALLKIDNTLTGTSYPGFSESTGGNG